MIGKVNCNTPSFSARIVQTPYFKEGLHSAMKFKDDNISLDQKVDFLNAVKLIKNDKSMNEFKIEGIGKLQVGKSRNYQISVDGYVVQADKGYAQSVFDGPNCIDVVTRFAKERYGNVYADNLVASASGIAKDIDKQQNALHEFINSELIEDFSINELQLVDDHRKVFDELPNIGLKYIDTYY